MLDRCVPYTKKLMSMGKRQLLFLTLILKVVDSGYTDSKDMGKIDNDLKNICLVYCLVLT